jgi:hypothetical protein
MLKNNFKDKRIDRCNSMGYTPSSLVSVGLTFCDVIALSRYVAVSPA